MRTIGWYLPLLIMMLFLLGPWGVALAHLDGTNGFNYVGYWEGIDPEDGVVGHLSITHMMEGEPPEITEIPENPQEPETPLVPETPEIPDTPEDPEDPEIPEDLEGVGNPEEESFMILTSSSSVVPFCEGAEGYSMGTAKIVEGTLISEDREIVCPGIDSDTRNASPVLFIPNNRDDVLMMEFISGNRGPILFHRVTSKNIFRGLFGQR